MPRSNTGVYTLPNGTLVSEGDVISPDQHNPAFNDVGDALTDSLSRTGRGTMQANLNMGGNRIQNMAAGIADTDAATVAQLNSGAGTPTGSVLFFAGNTPPNGWLLCGGQSISRTAYAALFAVIGTTYGSVDGNSFNLPDCRGRVSAGRDFAVASATAGRLTSTTMSPDGSTLGAAGGAQTVTLSQANIPAHTHSFSGTTGEAGTHSHSVNEAVLGSGGSGGFGPDLSIGTTGSAGAHTHTISGTTGSVGSGSAVGNVQPTILFNVIIKV